MLIDPVAYRHAGVTCRILAIVFTAFTGGDFLLVITSPVDRPSRASFGFVTLAAACALWVVWVMMRHARNPRGQQRRHRSPRR